MRGGEGRYYDKVMLNLTSNERRDPQGLFRDRAVTNPDFDDPLRRSTYEDYKARNNPRNFIVMDSDYQTPVNDQVSRSASRSRSGRATRCRRTTCTPRARTSRCRRACNYFEDPDTDLPRDPDDLRPPVPARTRNITWTRRASRATTRLQIGFNGAVAAASTIQSQLHVVENQRRSHGNRGGTPTNPFNSTTSWPYSQYDQRHRFTINVNASRCRGTSSSRRSTSSGRRAPSTWQQRSIRSAWDIPADGSTPPALYGAAQQRADSLATTSSICACRRRSEWVASRSRGWSTCSTSSTPRTTIAGPTDQRVLARPICSRRARRACSISRGRSNSVSA